MANTDVDNTIKNISKLEEEINNDINNIKTLKRTTKEKQDELDKTRGEFFNQLKEKYAVEYNSINTNIKGLESEIENLKRKSSSVNDILNIIQSRDYSKTLEVHTKYSGEIVKVPIICLALEPYNNRETNTQPGFLEKNVDMSTLANYFLSMQQANKLKNSSNKDEREIGEAYIKSLNQDIRKWAMTGDRIIYKEFPNITYIQKYGTQSAKETNIIITQEGYTSLKKFLDHSEENYNAAKIMLGTDLSRNDIITEIKEFTGYKEDNQYIGFSEKERRVNVKESPVLLGINDSFSIVCNFDLYGDGCARGGA